MTTAISFQKFTSCFEYEIFETTQLKNARGTEDMAVAGYITIDVHALLRHAAETNTYVAVGWRPLRVIISPDADAAGKEEISLLQATPPQKEIEEVFTKASRDGMRKHAPDISQLAQYLRMLRTSDDEPLKIQPYPDEKRIIITFGSYAGVGCKTHIGMIVLQHVMGIRGISATIGETDDKQRPYIDVLYIIHTSLYEQISFDTEQRAVSIAARIRRPRSPEHTPADDDDALVDWQHHSHQAKRPAHRRRLDATALSDASSSSASTASATSVRQKRAIEIEQDETAERRRAREDAIHRYCQHLQGPVV
jgi:hypothetical protein